MVIIVWLSIALVVFSLIWLVVRAVKEIHRAKEIVIRCSKSAEILRKGTESILKHNEKLQEATKNMTRDLDRKCKDLIFVKDQSGALVSNVRHSGGQLIDAYWALSSKAEV